MSYTPKIVCAAMLMKDGLIVPGVRHFSPDMRLVLKRVYGEGYHLEVQEQGFIDSKGTFLSRELPSSIEDCTMSGGKLLGEVVELLN